jgi:hypothetical protein
MDTSAPVSSDLEGIARSMVRRRRVVATCLVVGIAIVSALIIYHVTLSGADRLFASAWTIALPFAALASAYVGVAAWGCPACAASLGPCMDPWFCGTCGTNLKGGQSPPTSRAGNTGRASTRNRIARIIIIGGVLTIATAVLLRFTTNWAPRWLPLPGAIAALIGKWLKACDACGAPRQTTFRPRFCMTCGRPQIVASDE